MPRSVGMLSAIASAETSVQLTITLYFLAFGLSQFLWGPMADALPGADSMRSSFMGSVGEVSSANVAYLMAVRYSSGVFVA